jgi:ABC-2 type transport system ATP-binding protein
MSVLIETQNLSKHYGEIQALKNFTVKIDSGAIGLLGPNGAGKSTLIKTLLGLIPATSGTGKVFSRDIFKDALLIRQRIGYMPEHDCLLPDLNAVSYLSFLGELSGLSPRDSMQRSHEALYYVKIGDERYREISTYSTGMKQKVKLAQTLIHDPELIFLDEPTTGLDPNGRREMLKLVKGIVEEQGKNLLFSSHILPDIEQICDKVVILNHGELITEGKLQDLLFERNPDLVIRVRGPIGRFLQLLRKDGLKPEKRKNDIVVKVAPNVTKRVVELAAEAEVQLRYLNSQKRSLEELFVKIIEENERFEDKNDNFNPLGEK